MEEENNKEDKITEEKNDNNDDGGDNSSLIIILAAIVILAVIGGFFFFARSNRVQNLIGKEESPTTQMPEAIGENAVVLANQEPGDSVTIGFAVMAQPGFIVIHEDDDGTPGAIIGVSDLVTESAQDLEITLDRPSVDGEVLYAMLHNDDDGDGEFTFPDADGPVVDANGNVVQTQFFIGVSENGATSGTPSLMQGETDVEDAS